MWDAVVIGGSAQPNCSGRPVPLPEPVPSNFAISENRQAYLITGVILRLGMTVYKNTTIGQQLMVEIATGHDGVYLQRFLLGHFLPVVTPSMLQRAIESALDVARRRGRQDKAEEIRQVLYND